MVESRRGHREDEENPRRINRWEQNRRTYKCREGEDHWGKIQVAGLKHRRKLRAEQMQNKTDGWMDGRMNVPLLWHHHRQSRSLLTVGEVGHFFGQRRIAEVFIWHVHVHILLGFGCFEEGHETCREGRHKDGQHAKVQHIPQVHDVLSGPVAPDLLTLRPDHAYRTSGPSQPKQVQTESMAVLRINKHLRVRS